MRVCSLLLWPVLVVWALVRLVFWPVVLLATCYGVFALFRVPHGWFVLVAVLMGLYLVVVVRVWSRVLVGSLRSMARGTVTVRTYGRGGQRRHNHGGARRSRR